MKTSSQLTNRLGCVNNSDINLTSINGNMIRSVIVKNIAKRMILGEPITDIKGELNSMFSARKYKWEDNAQKEEMLNRFESAIKKFVEFESDKDHVYLDDVDTTVDVFGEEVIANPDFIRETEDGIEVCRISIGKPLINHRKFNPEDLNYEDYALGLLGKKLFPDKDIYVTHLYMNANDKKEKGYNSFHGERKQLFDEETEQNFITKHEMDETDRHECSAQACASCVKNNICHYEEPPIAIESEEVVRPITDIRLTNAQRQIVDYETGVARVNAGAGAGKTLVVALRVANLIEKGAKPEDICLLTFTKAGAEEMTTRSMSYAAAKGVPLDPERFTSGTINSFCQRIINEHYLELGYTRQPRIVPNEIKYKIIHDIIGNRFPKISGWNYGAFTDMRRWNPYLKGDATNEAVDLFEMIKTTRKTKEEFIQTYPGWKESDVNTLFGAYEAYNAELKERGLMEFTDQLNIVMDFSETHPNLFEELGYKHIIIDEFQDTDYEQIKLLNKMIDTQCFKSFMAVGDDSQSIYGFRYTSPEFMINFEHYFGHFDDFTLAENHRSNKATIDFANQVNEMANERVAKDLLPFLRILRSLYNIPVL